MPTKNNETIDGLTNYINLAIEHKINLMQTANMATITGFSNDNKMINVRIDTTGIELQDIVPIIIGGNDTYINPKVVVGDKCLLIFSRDSNEDWLSGGNDLVYASDFNINNGFALCGIRNLANAIEVGNETEIKVPDGIKITNDTNDMVSLINEGLGFLSTTSEYLSTASVVITSGSSAGTWPLSTNAQFLALQVQIDALIAKFEEFVVS